MATPGRSPARPGRSADEARMLTTHDRCDRCGAQAYYVVFFAAGELTFCSHHAREHMPVFIATAEAIYDGRDANVPARPIATTAR